MAKAAPGRVGQMTEMVDKQVLVDLWSKLASQPVLKTCFRTVLPMPKKK